MIDKKPKLKTKLKFDINFSEDEINQLDFTPKKKKRKLSDIIIFKKKKNGTKSGTGLF